MEILKTTAETAALVSTISAAIVLFIKPLREKVFGLGQIKDGVKCLLRQQMLNTYYRHKDEAKVRQYEYENFMYSYAAYKTLKGNSFIDKIKSEVETWEVVS